MSNYIYQLVVGLLLPLVGTTLGCSMIFILKKDMDKKVEKVLLGFASGVMIAASVWSLLIPSIDMASGIKWLPAAVGFIVGILFLLLLDTVIPHLHLNNDKPEGLPSKLNKSFMLVLAVTLHNIPEGMAVGVVLAAMLKGSEVVTPAAPERPHTVPGYWRSGSGRRHIPSRSSFPRPVPPEPPPPAA